VDNVVYKLTESIVSAWNNKYVAGIFCDLTKAFDSVSHELLINIPQFYVITGVFVDFFKPC
jgi:hypothetical protein